MPALGWWGGDLVEGKCWNERRGLTQAVWGREKSRQSFVAVCWIWLVCGSGG